MVLGFIYCDFKLKLFQKLRYSYSICIYTFVKHVITFSLHNIGIRKSNTYMYVLCNVFISEFSKLNYKNCIYVFTFKNLSYPINQLLRQFYCHSNLKFDKKPLDIFKIH